MDGYRECLLFELLDDVGDQSILLLSIVPDTYCSVRRASSYNRFLQADVHAKNWVRVEAADEVVISLEVVRVATVEGDGHFEDLVRAHCENYVVFFGRKGHAQHFHVSQVAIELRIGVQFSLVRSQILPFDALVGLAGFRIRLHKHSEMTTE